MAVYYFSILMALHGVLLPRQVSMCATANVIISLDKRPVLPCRYMLMVSLGEALIIRAQLPITKDRTFSSGSMGMETLVMISLVTIDEVCVYSQALSAQEVLALFNSYGSDTTKPTVISTSPGSNATGVAINSAVTATFSEAMKAATIGTSTFTVNNGSTTTNISGTVSYSGATATFASTSNLANSTRYTAKITTGAQDLAGNAMATDYIWSFTTTTGDGHPPTGCWKFDEGILAIANDSVDANHGTDNGLIPGATWTTGTASVSGSALCFDGNDYVTRANPSSALKPSPQVAISAWINPTALDSSGSEVVSMGDSYALRVKTDGNIVFFYFDGTTWRLVTTTGVDVRVGEWHHIVGQKTGSALQIYVDGVPKGSLNNTGTITYNQWTDFFIGKHGNGDTRYDFIGYIDEVCVYSQALSAQEVLALFNSYGSDTTKPTVISTSPASNATGVAVNSAVTATFSEAMKAATIGTSTFTVNNGSTTTNISGTVSYSGVIATFASTSNLAKSTRYTAKITTGVQDLAGNAMATDYIWSFTTTTADGPSPTGCWKFDEGILAIANDSVDGNHGTIIGATWTTGKECGSAIEL